MQELFKLLWLKCFLIAYIIQVLTFITLDDVSKLSGLKYFLYTISNIITFIGFILFIIWLSRFNNTPVLKKLWIYTLIISFISMIAVLILYNNVSDKVTIVPQLLSGYSFLIFLGTVISYVFRISN